MEPSVLDEMDCENSRCLGWIELSTGSWAQCSIHYEGQLHPDTLALLFDEPAKLREEERKSALRFQVRQTRTLIASLQMQIKLEQQNLCRMELELINKTPTIKAMPAVKDTPLEIDLTDGDFI